jgi:hypothetical protein
MCLDFIVTESSGGPSCGGVKKRASVLGPIGTEPRHLYDAMLVSHASNRATDNGDPNQLPVQVRANAVAVSWDALVVAMQLFNKSIRLGEFEVDNSHPLSPHPIVQLAQQIAQASAQDCEACCGEQPEPHLVPFVHGAPFPRGALAGGAGPQPPAAQSTPERLSGSWRSVVSFAYDFPY